MLRVSPNIAKTPEEFEKLIELMPQEYYDELERLTQLAEEKGKKSDS